MTARPMEEERLLPCPFCGGDASVEKAHHTELFYVGCANNDCKADCGFAGRERDKITTAWNSRALLSLSAEVKGLREALEKIARQTLSVDMSVDDQLGGDFEGAYNYMIEDARAALSPIPTQGDEQARSPSAHSAPISHGNKGHDQ